MTSLIKDAVLDQLSARANVAQFVSFGPDLAQRFARVHGFAPNARFGSVRDALTALLHAAPEAAVNVRSFEPANPKSREFLYGLKQADEVVAHVTRLAAEGLHTIVNETVDVHDGGVSGVVFGELLEFAPGDTPRCVEQPGVASLPRAMGLAVLEAVYGFPPALAFEPEARVEFSVHPLRRGFRHEHTIVWELEHAEAPPQAQAAAASIAWPNRFSRLVGDKAFGLLVAQAAGLPVPRTTVITRAVAPFGFGTPTGTAEFWLRTCPTEQVPGRFTTQRGWTDPFRLLDAEDPSGAAIASVLAQEGVEPAYSGSLVSDPAGKPIVEGVRGLGDAFMVGRLAPEPLPEAVEQAVLTLYRQAAAALGPVRFEWVFDGQRVWVVQLHRGTSPTSGRTIFPGEPTHWQKFDVTQGIEALRALIARVHGSADGIVLVGHVGVTSHLGDLLRKARIPSRIEPEPNA